jgi:hypothetical protein
MRLNALVYTADVLTHNWRSLAHAASSAGPDPKNINHNHRITILSCAWSIVDQLNAARQIIEGLLDLRQPNIEVGPVTAELMRLLQPFRQARNKMDHLNQNLPNMSARKRGVPPMLGSVSYAYVEPGSQNQVTALTVQTGATLGDGWFPLVNPIGQKCQLPAGLFQLYAFEEALELGPPLKALKQWADAVTPEWEKEMRAAALKVASATGKAFDELFAFNPPNLVLGLKMTTEQPTG